MPNDNDNEGKLIDCHGSSKALRLLNSLNKTATGKVLFQQIERILHDTDHTQNKILHGYTALVLTMIDAYRRRLPKESLLYFELKLIQKRLIPPVSISELATIQSYLKKASRLINELTDVDDDVINEALGPLLGKHNFEETTPQIFENIIDTDTALQSNNPLYKSNKSNIDYKELKILHTKITKKIKSASEQYTEFSQSLDDSLQHLSGKTDANKIAPQLIQEIQSLQVQQKHLSTIFNETTQLVERMTAYTKQLDEELNQVRVLSLTDDLTHLPNRRAFIRRLEDEISRSQREATPLILGLLDLDYFKEINDRFGHSVGDIILQIYATDILSVFRHYDMIARYGGEEFAVILPNTDFDGAARAMMKVKEKAAGYIYKYENTKIALPSFSAGLAMHQPGESSTEFIERVDSLLYRAKQDGRDQVQYDKQFSRQTETHDETSN